jgi:hypothetical protein
MFLTSEVYLGSIAVLQHDKMSLFCSVRVQVSWCKQFLTLVFNSPDKDFTALHTNNTPQGFSFVMDEILFFTRIQNTLNFVEGKKFKFIPSSKCETLV